MGGYSKVVWSEGVYLSPQHFQQSDRYYESSLQELVKYSKAHYYGCINLSIEPTLLQQGVIGISNVAVIFEDGTLFAPSSQEIAKLNYSLPPNSSPTKIYLVVAAVSAKNNEIAFEDNKGPNTRYYSYEKPLIDTTNDKSDPRDILLAQLNVSIMVEEDISSNLLKLPIGIVSSNNNGEVSLDERYIPPTLIAQNNPILNGYINEIYGLLLQKSKSLAGAVNDPNRGGSLEVIDFLMLQTANRYLAYMLHQQQGAIHTHPEDLFVELSKLCADLMTFLPSRKMGDMPIYNHRNLQECFHHLMSNLRISLSTVLEQRIIRIDLNQKDEATYVAQTPNAQILDTADFVLAVKADIPNETLRQRLPSTMKISTVEKIRELVAYHLPGIKLNALSIAPRELPYHNGYVYFELEKQTELWEYFNDTSGIAFHIAGDFPNIDLEFWAIKPTV